MKYSNRIYAKALVDLMAEKKSVNEKKMVDNFLKILQKNGDLKKAKQIILLAEKLYLQKTGNKNIIIETARKISSKGMLDYFVKKNDVVEEKVNPEIIAGIKIIINNEQQLDFSLSKKLEEVFNYES